MKNSLLISLLATSSLCSCLKPAANAVQMSNINASYLFESTGTAPVLCEIWFTNSADGTPFDIGADDTATCGGIAMTSLGFGGYYAFPPYVAGATYSIYLVRSGFGAVIANLPLASETQGTVTLSVPSQPKHLPSSNRR